MKVKSVEKLEKSMVALTIEADAQEFEAAINKVFLKQRGRIMIPGFRKGKAPRKMVEAMYGAEIFYEDAINEIYPDLFAQAVEQEKLDTVAYPEVELLDASKDGFSFKATVAVRPEVKLGKYKGLTAPKDVAKVTEKDIDGELRPYIQRATRMVDVDRKAKKGDTVTIDFEGFMAGKEATFKVKVHTVKERVEPALDDEFAKDVSEFETLKELRKDLGDKLAERRERQAQNAFEEVLLDQVTENMTVEIPDAMVDARAERMLEEYSQRITNQGISFEQYLAMTGLTVDMLKLQASEGALRQVKTDLALGAIAKAEKIEVTEEEMDAECARLAEQYGMPVEEVKKIVPVEELRSDLSNQKASKVIFDSAKAGKAPAKKATKATESAEEKKPVKKTAAKKDEAKEEKKSAVKKTAAKSEEEKPAAKKTTKKSKE